MCTCTGWVGVSINRYKQYTAGSERVAREGDKSIPLRFAPVRPHTYLSILLLPPVLLLQRFAQQTPTFKLVCINNSSLRRKTKEIQTEVLRNWERKQQQKRCRLEGAKDTISHLFWLIIFSCLRLSFLSWVSLSSCVCYEYGCWRVCNFVCVCDTFWHGWYSTASCDLTLSVDHRLLYIFRRGWNFFSRLYCRRRDGLLRLLVKQ